MKKTLLQLVGEQKELLNKIIDSDGELDESTENALALTSTELTAKADSIGFLLSRIEHECEWFKMQEQELAQKRKRLEKMYERIEGLVKLGMQSMQFDVLHGEVYQFKFRKNKPSVVIQDLSKVPQKFIKTTVTSVPDKVAMYDAMKSGEVIEGATLESSVSLSCSLNKGVE
jgi:hypothetical protein